MATDRLGQTIAVGDVYMLAGRVLRIDGDNVVLVHGLNNEHRARVKAGDVIKVDSAGGLPAGSAGDVLVHNGTSWVPLPPGEPGQYLKVGAGGAPEWGDIEL